jgi:hypothetical protein
LGVSAGSGLKVAPTVAGLRGVFTGGVFFVVARLEVFVVQGELLAPLILGGFDAWGVALAAFRLRGCTVLGFSSPLCASFAKELRSMSCGTLHKLQS